MDTILMETIRTIILEGKVTNAELEQYLEHTVEAFEMPASNLAKSFE